MGEIIVGSENTHIAVKPIFTIDGFRVLVGENGLLLAEYKAAKRS